MADLTSILKQLSMVFQTHGVLFSEVSAGVQNCIEDVLKLQDHPGKWMKVFEEDYNEEAGTFDGIPITAACDAGFFTFYSYFWPGN